MIPKTKPGGNRIVYIQRELKVTVLFHFNHWNSFNVLPLPNERFKPSTSIISLYNTYTFWFQTCLLIIKTTDTIQNTVLQTQDEITCFRISET